MTELVTEYDVPQSSLYHRALGRRSRHEAAEARWREFLSGLLLGDTSVNTSDDSSDEDEDIDKDEDTDREIDKSNQGGISDDEVDMGDE